MECAACGTSNPDTNHFCGKCGTRLDPLIQQLRTELNRELGEKLTAATKDWREQKLLDIETTEAILDRIQKWTKAFLFFVGLPAFLIVAWLAMQGYRSYADFQAKIKQTSEEIEPKLKAAAQNVDALNRSVDALNQRTAGLNSTLDAASRVVPQLQSLTSRVDLIQKQIVNIQNANGLSSDRLSKLQSLLSGFNSYLLGLGFSAPKVIPTVTISTDSPEESSVGGDRITIGSTRVDDPSSYLWSYAYPVFADSNLPSDNRYFSQVLEHYYSGSFLEKEDHSNVHDITNPHLNWVEVCWQVRQAIGKDAADHFFAFAVRMTGLKFEGDEDVYIKQLLSKASEAYAGGRYKGQVSAIVAGDLSRYPMH